MGDAIETLPTDKVPATDDEKEILKWMFADQKEFIKHKSRGLWDEFQIIVTASLLFILFLLPMDWVGNLIKRFIPFTEKNEYSLIFCKAVLFGISLWLFSNIQTSQNTYQAKNVS